MEEMEEEMKEEMEDSAHPVSCATTETARTGGGCTSANYRRGWRVSCWSPQGICLFLVLNPMMQDGIESKDTRFCDKKVAEGYQWSKTVHLGR